MIYKLLEDVITEVRDKFVEAKEVRLYRGEFEEGSEWNPTFPVILVAMSQALPKAQAQKTITSDVTINLYYGVDSNIKAQRDGLDSFVTGLNDLLLSLPKYIIGVTSASLRGIYLQGYFKGTEAYRFEISITKKF